MQKLWGTQLLLEAQLTINSRRLLLILNPPNPGSFVLMISLPTYLINKKSDVEIVRDRFGPVGMSRFVKWRNERDQHLAQLAVGVECG